MGGARRRARTAGLAWELWEGVLTLAQVVHTHSDATLHAVMLAPTGPWGQRSPVQHCSHAKETGAAAGQGRGQKSTVLAQPLFAAALYQGQRSHKLEPTQREVCIH